MTGTRPAPGTAFALDASLPTASRRPSETALPPGRHAPPPPGVGQRGRDRSPHRSADVSGWQTQQAARSAANPLHRGRPRIAQPTPEPPHFQALYLAASGALTRPDDFPAICAQPRQVKILLPALP